MLRSPSAPTHPASTSYHIPGTTLNSIAGSTSQNGRRRRNKKPRKDGQNSELARRLAEEDTPRNPGQGTHMLASSSGPVNIHDGEFNAVGGSHINVTINAEPRPHQTRNSKPKKQYSAESHTNIEANQVTPVIPQRHEGISRVSSQPPSDLPVQRSCDIYYRHLAPKGRGSPLWIPEPNKRLSIEYQRAGTRIGDVGIITSRGNFDFLFNVCLEKDHPINPKQMPEAFEPFVLDPSDIQEYSEFKEDSFLSSSSIKNCCQSGNSSGLAFESSALEGAILTMPVGSNSEDLGNITGLRSYVAAHAENWYRYINIVRGREAQNGDVRLVTGFDKTSAWGMATFANTTSEKESFHLRFRPFENCKIGKTYGWDYSGMAEARAGPDAKEVEKLRMNDPSQEGKNYENQCLFVRTLNVMLQTNVWDKLRKEFGGVFEGGNQGHPSSSTYSPWCPPGWSSTSGMSSSGGSSSSSSYGGGYGGTSRNCELPCTGMSILNHAPSAVLTYHPSTAVNSLLLQLNKDAKVAVTHDHDWISVMTRDDRILPSDEDLVERISQRFSFTNEDGIVFLETRHKSNFDTTRSGRTNGVQHGTEDNAKPSHSHHTSGSRMGAFTFSNRFFSTRVSTKKALLIGIQMDHSGLLKNNVKTSHRDVREMRKVLTEVYHYNPGDITVLLDDGGPGHILPTRDNILKQLRSFTRYTKDNDRLFFHFSGHSPGQSACSVKAKEGHEGERIVTSDGRSISDTELRQALIDKLPPTSTLTAIFDCCHSGTLLDFGKTAKNYTKSNVKSMGLPYYRGDKEYMFWKQPPRTTSFNRKQAEQEWQKILTRNAYLYPGSLNLNQKFPPPITLPPPYVTFDKRSIDPQTNYMGNCQQSEDFSESNEDTRADVICIYASENCRQYEKDMEGGTMTAVLINALRRNPNQSLSDVLKNISRKSESPPPTYAESIKGGLIHGDALNIIFRKLSIEKTNKGINSTENGSQYPQVLSFRPLDMNRSFLPIGGDIMVEKLLHQAFQKDPSPSLSPP